tara:strand:+ start:2852 stop:5179 length:2328 start_codon:yes stop_codon:yes gene_type:complete
MKLVIVESPAKCKKIQGFLGKDYIVKSSYGHFRDLSKEDLGIDVKDDFKPNYIILKDKSKVVSDLKATMKKCDTLYLAADNDREGEAIAWHLNEVLNKGKNTSKRILFNEITKTAIINAVNTPGLINTNMFCAQQARRIIDRLVGFKISPCLWKNIQSTYKKGKGLSAGRVQSVVNKLIIERENSITNFEKKSYYNLGGNVEYNKNSFPIKMTKKLNNKKNVVDIFDKTKTHQFIVSDIKNKEKKENAKAPFTTSTLQQEANNKLNMSSKQTMMVAQSLYEGGLITYMRTDSIIISEDAHKEIKQRILDKYGEKYYKKNTFKTKTKNAQEAHEACRVTNIELEHLGENYSNDMQRLYQLIWKRTISSQMSPMIKDVLDVVISLDTYVFNSVCEKIKFDGYMIVYNLKKEEKNTQLKELKKGTILEFLDFIAEQKYSTPENRFSDSTLVKKLEELGIGRPSTYANMVSSIIDKEYAVIKDNSGIDVEIEKLLLKKTEYEEKKEIIKYGNDKGKINPTQTGIIINNYLDKHFSDIINYEFTANLELELDKISNGDATWNNIVSIVYTTLVKNINNSSSSSQLEKDNYSRIIGVNPNTENIIDVYIGQYGPVLREKSNNKKVKDRFICIKDLNLDNITLDIAMELLKYPIKVGSYKKKDIFLQKGRYGLYIVYNSTNYTMKDIDESNIDVEEIIKAIEFKDNNKSGSIRKINDKLKVMNGQYGYYINYNNKSNYSIRFDKNDTEQDKLNYIDELTEEKCYKIIEYQKSYKAKKKFNKK